MTFPPAFRRRRPRHAGTGAAGFSLIELVIVVVIIGLVAAIAVPRLSRGSAAAAESAFVKNLTSLRRAIEHYYVEHGEYPTCLPAGTGTTTIMLQLTQYTDGDGNTSATRSDAHPYGPYLRAIPPIMVGRYKDATKISASELPNIGWVYTPATGEIRGYSEGAVTLPSGKTLASY